MHCNGRSGSSARNASTCAHCAFVLPWWFDCQAKETRQIKLVLSNSVISEWVSERRRAILEILAHLKMSTQTFHCVECFRSCYLNQWFCKFCKPFNFLTDLGCSFFSQVELWTSPLTSWSCHTFSCFEIYQLKVLQLILPKTFQRLIIHKFCMSVQCLP